MHNNYIVESEARIPIVDQVDVVVADGGLAVMGAAVGAWTRSHSAALSAYRRMHSKIKE